MLVLGAGAAGLSIARTLSDAGVAVNIAESSDRTGGLSTTIEFAGGLVDLGPHVIGDAYPRVNTLFHDVLGEEAVQFQRRTTMQWQDCVFSYPPGILEIAKDLGVLEAMRICYSYSKSRLSFSSDTPANYRIAANHKFGKRLVDTCLAPYLEKFWGTPCENIDGNWQPGRVRNQSLIRLALRTLTSSSDSIVTHPRLGAKQFYDLLADSMKDRAVSVELNCPVSVIRHDGSRVTSVEFDGAPPAPIHPGAHSAVFSTIPLPVVVDMLDPSPPDEIVQSSRALKFRNTILVYLLVPGDTDLCDHIRYINDHRFTAGRVTNFTIWTNGMARVAPSPNQSGPVTTLCIEFWTGFDGLWNHEDDMVIRQAVDELIELGILTDDHLIDQMVVRVARTHPICTIDAVRQLHSVLSYLDSIKGLKIAGRSGSFLYADQDQVIDQSIRIAENTLATIGDFA